MKSQTLVFAVLIFLVLMPPRAQAAEYYWSFNSAPRLEPDIGYAGMAVDLDGIGILWTSFGPGTSVNAMPGYGAGEAISDIDIGSVFSTLEITMTGLDFTGLNGIGISFATRSTALFSLGDNLRIDFDIGGGFSGAYDVALPDATWSGREVDFGDALDNLSNVSIRMTLSGLVEVLEVVEFDNIQIVPEPSSALLASASMAFLAFARRRRAVR